MHEHGTTLGYWIAHIHRLIAATFGEFLREWCQARGKPYVLTPPQWGILSQLAEEDGLPIGIMGQRRAVDAPTVTDMVGRMERNGLVTRVHDQADRRLVRVFLTGEGQIILQNLPADVDGFYARLMAGISPEELRTTFEVLGKLRDTMLAMSPQREAPTATLPPWTELD